MKHFFCILLCLILFSSILVFPALAADLPNNAKVIFEATSNYSAPFHNFGTFDFELVDGASYYVQITGTDFTSKSGWFTCLMTSSVAAFSGLPLLYAVSPSATGNYAPFAGCLIYRNTYADPLTITIAVVSEPTDFLTEIGSVFVMLMQWVGAVVVSLVTPDGELFPLMIVCAVGIGVSILLYASKFIRR